MKKIVAVLALAAVCSVVKAGELENMSVKSGLRFDGTGLGKQQMSAVSALGGEKIGKSVLNSAGLTNDAAGAKMPALASQVPAKPEHKLDWVKSYKNLFTDPMAMLAFAGMIALGFLSGGLLLAAGFGALFLGGAALGMANKAINNGWALH